MAQLRRDKALCVSAPHADTLRDERGSVTAEFAVALPAVLLVLMLAIGSIMLATQRLALTSAAAQMARLEARGDAGSASTVLGGIAMRGGVAVHRSAQGPLHCVTLSASPAGGALSAIQISGRGCAAVSEAGR